MAEANPDPQVPLASTGNNNQQAATEAQQEELLKAKYGGLLPKKKLIPKDNRYFDSADWQMNKQQGAPIPKLEPKLGPSAPPPRRNSHLSDGH